MYSFYYNPESTPQTEAIPGKNMIRGRAGGMAFEADIWQKLRRCLLIGTSTNTYYAGKNELTSEFAQVVEAAVAIDPCRVASEVLYASNGHALNNSAPIFALVLLSKADSKDAKKAFKEIFPQVVRTGSHFYEWLNYTKSSRGMGRLVKEAGLSWLSQPTKDLAYQLLKYQERYGFSSRDALRLFKPSAKGNQQNLFSWVINGWEELPNLADVHPDLHQIWWYEWLKRNPEKGVIAVRDGRLTHEMVTGIAKMDRSVWRQLFLTMPINALLRNLGSLTEIGVLRVDAVEDLDLVESRLTNHNLLRERRVHPLDVLKALKVYGDGGRTGRSSKTWTPIPRINDILNEALELSFDTLEPTGKVFLHALDVSGSMSAPVIESSQKDKNTKRTQPVSLIRCCEVAAMMALTTAKAEKNYIIRGFLNRFIDLDIQKSDTFTNALAKTRAHNFGATDASLAYEWALENKVKVDVFCSWTDGESFAGRRHPSQALAEYRRKINPKAKAVYVTLAPYNITQVDRSDPLSYDLAGFDPSIPKYVQMIANGEI